MSDKDDLQRREKLRAVVVPLSQHAEFTRDDAKQICHEATARYVTLTLKQLVASEAIRPVEVDGVERFRWNAAKSFEAETWIDGLIHGVQIKQSPEQERPREKLSRLGADQLSNGELLAILIRSGIRGESAVIGGNKLAARMDGKLETMPKMTCDEVRSITKSVNIANYAQIMAGIELGRRIAAILDTAPAESVKITSTAEAIDYCQRVFARLACDGVQEEFHIVTLDTKHKPVASHRITVGTLDASLVHPREVFRPAIRDSAAAILLVHNHPSGDPTPSREDHAVTDRLTEAGKLIGINVLDHIVVARERSVSIRECV